MTPPPSAKPGHTTPGTITRRVFLLGLVLPALVRSARADPATAQADNLIPLVEAARSQIGVTRIYDPAYVSLAYPNGDVASERGVCTDVIIRAYRKAYHCDLQRLVHEDMAKAFQTYPTKWGRRRPDSNIDHRRVPNLQTFFTRRKAQLKVSTQGADYRPGDLVTQMLPGNLPHIVIVSDRRRDDGVPLVIQNIGKGASEDDYLFGSPITGHYRFLPPVPPAPLRRS